MLKQVMKFLAFAAVPMVFAQSVHASLLYDFSYDFDSTQSISGQLMGDLQSDGDTIHATDVFATIFTPSGPFTVDTDADYFVDRNDPAFHDTFGLVSLSGLNMDFILHKGVHSTSCSNVDSVCLVSAVSLAFVGGSPVAYSPANWSITSTSTSVPEPASLALLVLGLAGLRFVRRR